MEIRTRSFRTHSLRSTARRLVAAGASLLLVAAGLAVTAAPASADAPSPTSDAGVVPIHVPGAANRSCQALADELTDGDTWTEVKFEADRGEIVTGATKDDVTLTRVEGTVLDWTSATPVVAVYVKSGSQGSNLYHYPAGSTGDEGLGTPGLEQAISHVSFCSGPLSIEEPPPLDCELTPTAEGCEESELTCEDDPSLEGCEESELTCEDDPSLEGCEELELTCEDDPSLEGCEVDESRVEPELTCADDPDLEGCTQLGTSVFIENTVENPQIVTDAPEVVATPAPGVEVQGAVFTQPAAGVEGVTQAQAGVQTLPQTGVESRTLAGAALALLLAGAGLTLASRRDQGHMLAA